ncbi:MAG: hypothetical protein IPK19_04685 [Chloroflexi bacterium]|nr:hypothetical protein [Chloroflexota bacterium]
MPSVSTQVGAVRLADVRRTAMSVGGHARPVSPPQFASWQANANAVVAL